MYDKNKKLGKSLSWKPISPTFCHFPHQLFTLPESPQPCNTTSNLNSPHSHPSLLQAGSSWLAAVAGRAHWVSGFVLTLEPVLLLEKSQTSPSPS